ncbi:MAG TPA: preprotein translocase subunit SecY [Anaerolineales bacterium]|uniref:Protein translocase subunit SecY n=1 Tax=uncultured Chloroflexi bacterium Rifle_16ft_4_minimus_6153 TaxID=1665079 RepID=A0A0H4T9H2_9CHLR|nr:preprotein translocase subunit, preprotein translocase subunit SecY [uncultured Chloroflexi bacterium Rifle_16ft_4_minimus_6153]HLE30596.1 preprotein translocase subunit SecY [Anaerolineales bacterium]
MSDFFSSALRYLRRLWGMADIRNRLLITLGLLMIYRFAAHVPVPGVNPLALRELLEQTSTGAGTLVGLLDLLSGGTVSTFSVLAMGVYPYITAQIILQLLVPIIPRLQRIMEEDPRQGREFMERWTYYLAVPMAALNAFGQVRLILSLQTGAPILNFNLGFNLPTFTMIITMTGGTMFAIWLGELISEYGVRNQGLSLIIFAGIVSRVPSNMGSLLADEQNRWRYLGTFLVVVILSVLVIVFVQQGRRNVPVMYPGRRIGQRQSMPVRGNLPLQVNMAGMIPVIFAQSILTFPAIIAQFFTGAATEWVSKLALDVSNLFGGQSPYYWVIYFFMVVAFTFFYTDVIFSQQNYGENLKRVGAQVPGVTKGAPTQKYLTKVLRRITLPGAVFLGAVAIMPFLVRPLIPAATNFSILSTGLLIVVGVVRDTFFTLDAELKLRGYEETLLVK